MYEIILNTWERNILREAYSPVIKQGVWRMGNNKELRKYMKPPIL
jgi:hypothetical protein